MSLRTQLTRLQETDDLVTITDHVHWDETAASIASEAIKHSGPAVRFESTPGRVRFASGVYGGPDQFDGLEQQSWQRIAQDLGLGTDCSYLEVVERLSREETAGIDGMSSAADATPVGDDVDLYSLGLPMIGDEGYPLVTLGLLAVQQHGTTTWVPIRGAAQRSTKLRLSVPQAFVDWCGPQAQASVVLGVSAVPLIAALQGWTQDRIKTAVPELAAGLSEMKMAAVDSRVVPADAEVRIDGQMTVADSEMNGPKAAWELACDTATVEVRADTIASRDDPIVAFTPLGAPLTDDIQLMSLVEGAQLFRRVNNYWGVSPVEWIQLPVEARLGLCIVSSEILYAGFEWQLANTLFSFSDLFDKVLVLDEEADPTNLARAIDDMWVKAHPANDWIFSEPNASSAAATQYRRNGEYGSRLYINATWDPRWDEEYIAPRVTFETAFSESALEALGERWDELDLDELIGEKPDNHAHE